MGFLEPEPTQFDLRWRMFGIRVRVHPVFWLMACVLGGNYLNPPYGAPYLLVWVACVFLSILIHELGHVVVGRLFGSRGDIVLYAFGGLAIGSNDVPRRWQRFAVLFAGPFAGFLLLGAVYVARPLIFPRYYWPQELTEAERFLQVAFEMLFWINLVWGILNLLPIYPLDGGQISRELFTAVNPRNGFRIALWISIGLAALIAVHSIMASQGRPLIPGLPIGGSMYTTVLFGLMAVENVMMLQQLNAPPRQPVDDEDDWSWRR